MMNNFEDEENDSVLTMDWDTDDVIDAANLCGVKMTKEEASNWLDENECGLAEAMFNGAMKYIDKELGKVETEKIDFNCNGVDYQITNHKKGRIFFEFEGNCYGMNYDAVAALIEAYLDVVNSVEANA